MHRQSCSVLVRRWSTGEPLKLRVDNFAELRAQIIASPLLTDLTTPADASSSSSSSDSPSVAWKLYYFPRGSATWWRDRVKVDDEETFADYLAVYRSRMLQERPMLLLWMPPADCTQASHHASDSTTNMIPCDHSPLKESAPPADPLIPQPAPSVSSPSVRSGSSRSSTDQKPFAEGVYRRDNKLCVCLCRPSS